MYYEFKALTRDYRKIVLLYVLKSQFSIQSCLTICHELCKYKTYLFEMAETQKRILFKIKCRENIVTKAVKNIIMISTNNDKTLRN